MARLLVFGVFFVVLVAGFVQGENFREAGEVSIVGLRIAQAKDFFSDFIYSARYLFALSDSSRLGLIENRIYELDDREDFLARKMDLAIKSGDESVMGIVNDSWVRVVNAHIGANEAARAIMQRARERNDTLLENKAEIIVGMINENVLFFSLETAEERSENWTSNRSGSSVSSEISIGGGGVGMLTLEQAKGLVEAKTGVKAISATAETEGNVTVYIIKGFKEDITNSSRSFRQYEVKMRADTGEIVSSSVKSGAEASDGNARATGSSSASGDITETTTETSVSEGSVSSSARSSASSRSR